jgi:hypothetical protein
MSLSFLLLPTVGGSGRARADVLGRSLVVSGKERWWGGALTCSRAPNDNNVVLLLLTAGGIWGRVEVSGVVLEMVNGKG